ncbi:hypothetical protein, partial [Psychroserpens damuponensis]|uniref:hypothetical protein n=1 Tax=Psychroserpens damuponensis TaxID=943936 RepID=UPI000590FEDE
FQYNTNESKMKKKKSKKKKKGKSLNYKLFSVIGGIFHLIMYLLYDLTFYNDTLLWLSILFCGLIFGFYFIKKMELLNPKSYKKIEGLKLKLYMFFICFVMIIGGAIIFGNVINGTIIGLNYIGKNNETIKQEYGIQKIEQNSSGGRKRFRRYNPKVFIEKEGEIVTVNLSERYSKNKNYSEYRTIEMNLNKGLFGFEIIENYELKK